MSHDQAVDDNDQAAAHKGRGLGVEGGMFLGIAVFFFIAAIVYAIFASDEWVGIVALTLSGGLCLIIGTFIWFTGRRLEGPRPEDRDAEIAEGAGELGFFSPGSYWPLTIAATAALFAAATAFLLVWLMIIGGGLLIMAVCGLMFEYHRPPAH